MAQPSFEELTAAQKDNPFLNSGVAQPQPDMVADASSGAPGATSAMAQLAAAGVANPFTDRPPAMPEQKQLGEYDPKTMGPALAAGLPGSIITPAQEKKVEQEVKKEEKSQPMFSGGGQSAPKKSLEQQALEKWEQDQEDRDKIRTSQQENIDKRIAAFQSGQDTAAEQMKQIAAQDLVNSKDAEADLQKATSHFDQTNADLMKKNEALREKHSDPNKWYKDRGTAGTIAAAIAIGMGAFGASLTKSPNFAMELINKSIDRDIAAQDKDIEKEAEALKFEGNQADKTFVKETYISNKKNEARIQTRDHAIAQVNFTLQKTNNEDQIKQLNDLKSQLQTEQTQDHDRGIKLRLDVMVQQRAREAAAASAGQLSQKMLFEKSMELIKDPNFQPPPGVSREQAAANTVIAAWHGGKLTGGASVSSGKEDEKQVVVNGPDGKPTVRTAISKDAAKDYREYKTIEDEGKRLLAVMKRAHDTSGPNSGPAIYDAARAKFIELMPKLYGYNRGPSQAQVKVTFGPEAVPEYSHWYEPSLSSRVTAKLNELDHTINTIGQSMEKNTFIPSPQYPTQQPSVPNFSGKVTPK